MKLEDQVCSLDLSQKLEKLGVKQESLFYWKEFRGLKPYIVRPLKEDLDQQGLISAFTVAELLELLPYNTALLRLEEYAGEEWTCENSILNVFEIREDTAANALAKMLCYLVENGLLK